MGRGRGEGGHQKEKSDFHGFKINAHIDPSSYITVTSVKRPSPNGINMDYIYNARLYLHHRNKLV